MNYNELKLMMRKYLGDNVDSDELAHLFVHDPDVKYRYDYWSSCSNFTHLHKCVLLTNKYPELNNYLEEYLNGCSNIDEVSRNGSSALHLASSNSDISGVIIRLTLPNLLHSVSRFAYNNNNKNSSINRKISDDTMEPLILL